MKYLVFGNLRAQKFVCVRLHFYYFPAFTSPQGKPGQIWQNAELAGTFKENKLFGKYLN